MRKAATAISAAAVLLTSACASTGDRPVDELATARASIDLAEQNGAQEHSTQTITAAREKLARAETLAESGNHEQAKWLADQAEVDARLAAARAQLAKNEAAVEELRDSLSALEREINRNQ